MNDLVVQSFKAQCTYVSSRIVDKDKRYFFTWTSEYILEKLQHFDNPKKMEKYLKWETMLDGQQLAIDMFNETYYNIQERFETGYTSTDPIERIL